MAGFGGAVEDGARGVGAAISAVAAVGAGWFFGSVPVGLGVFVAGWVLSFVWGRLAGDAFRARALGQPEKRPGGDGPPRR